MRCTGVFIPSRCWEAPVERNLAACAAWIPEIQKERPLRPQLAPPCDQPLGWWPPWTRPAPLSRLPSGSAEPAARGPTRCTRHGPANSARLQPPGTGGHAGEIYGGAGRRLPGPVGAQAPITGSHRGPGPRPPSPRRRALARPGSPPAYSSPFMRTPSAAAAAAAASAAAVAVAGRPDWLAAAAPALSHGPRRVRLTGGAAGAALARGQANRGARGGEGPRPPAGLCPGPASRASPPPAPPPSPECKPGGAPAEPTHSRRAGVGAEGGGAVRSRPPPLSRPIPGAAVNQRREKPDWPGGGCCPGAAAPPSRPLARLPHSLALPRALGRGLAWERMVEF
ncbi:uncharacterized protein LOC128929864 [Callithrix jacchus]|uniref:basic proline-rich protein-like n=1 Tax=Callithrix jacchus TaxID=9483 RepID=UPI0023DD1938|nr:basic proline-rich protein-like [Callithrix jacchus]XP_054102422.1 basic proline-rich protein-like [Callithrix jacchus]XP_054102423.1 basic proline-rich protein-like [Callithrix jacchus]